MVGELTISTDAYERLKARKRDSESFSDVLKRLMDEVEEESQKS